MCRIAFALFTVVSTTGWAQDDRASGLFTEARHLPMVSQSISVSIASGEAEVSVAQVFHNDGPRLGQADYHLYLPTGASVVAFGFWNGATFLSATLKERGRAESAHRRAAGEGRATGLLKKESSIHSFSVYPVEADEQKRIELTFRVPISREMGRSHLPLPVDAFLSQPEVTTPVVVQINAEEPITDFGVKTSGRSLPPTVLGRTGRWLNLAFSTERPAEVWWDEDSQPLLIRADVVELGQPEANQGLQVRVALNDAGEWKVPYASLDVLVDASFSMRRKAGALHTLLGRIVDQSPAPTRIHAITEEAVVLGDLPLDQVVQTLLSGELGHSASWSGFSAVLSRLGCSAAHRCVVITDPQLQEVSETIDDVAVVYLGDAHELAHFATELDSASMIYRLDGDSNARLASLADEVVLPVMEVHSLEQDGSPIDLLGRGTARVAEGGMLRLFAALDRTSPVTLRGRIGERAFERTVAVAPIDPATNHGHAVRRGVFRELLAGWMRAYRNAPDDALKRRIVDVSVREGVPTAFTALQVDDPKLSLYAIKPGDPVLRVQDEPGLREVIAWYPFGETRRLAYDTASGVHSDRFLVPRGWSERSYRIEVFKRFADGSVRREGAWYRIDEQGPQAVVSLDRTDNILRVTSADESPDIGSVTIHRSDGTVLTLSPVGQVWAAPADELPQRFSIIVRDRAGNRTRFDCRLQDGELVVSAGRRSTPVTLSPKGTSALPLVTRAEGVDGSSLNLEGKTLTLTLADGKRLRFVHRDTVGSLSLTSYLQVAEHEHLIGSRAGDLVRLTCSPDGACEPHVLRARDHHPVTGIAKQRNSKLAIGILGLGLFQLRGDRLVKSRWRVGSRYITGLRRVEDALYVGTAYNGLWRIPADGPPTRALFPHQHVGALAVDEAGDLVLESGHGRFVRRGLDRFERVVHGDGPSVGSPDLTVAVRYRGQSFVAGFDGGLSLLESGRLAPIALGLRPSERRINDMVVSDDSLWLGTEGGLLRIRISDSESSCDVDVERVLRAAVHDLVGESGRLAVASSRGIYMTETASSGETVFRRYDLQRGVNTHRFMSVAWHKGVLFAGSMEGLAWFTPHAASELGAGAGFAAGWVTTLVDDGDRLLVGTYDEGVFAVQVDGATIRAAGIPELSDQWVPPNGIRRFGDVLWVGGLGMPPVRWADGASPERVPVPVRDTNSFASVDGGLLLLTSDGLVESPPTRHLAAR